jgi:hypothetical protein
MQKLFPGEMHIHMQELWVSMAHSISGFVTKFQFQRYFENTRPEFLFGRDKRHKLLQQHLRPKSASSLQHRVRSVDGEVAESSNQGQVVSPHSQRHEEHDDERSNATSSRGSPTDASAPLTPAEASTRARQRVLQSAELPETPHLPDSTGKPFKAVVLRARHSSNVSEGDSQSTSASSPKALRASRDAVRLQQYLSWLGTVLPADDHKAVGSDGTGLCSGLLLFKLLKTIGAPADRLHTLHLQMDHGVRTRALWLRNMKAIGDCVLACSSSVCVLEPELAVDGDPRALVALLRLIVQTFVVKKIPKTRVIEWCAAQLQCFNMTLQPRTLQFPHSNASFQQDFCDGVLLSLLLQRCISVTDEAVGSDAMLLLQESENHSSTYSNRHIAVALIITLGVRPFFNLRQMELKPIESNFMWMQLHAVYLAFARLLPAPAPRISAKPISEDKDVLSPAEKRIICKAALQEKRDLEAKSAELKQSMQRLEGVKRTLRVLNR